MSGGRLSTPAWWSLDTGAALAALESRAHGLDEADARARLARVGPNTLRRAAPTSGWSILLAQLESVVVALLATAVVIALVFGDLLDALAILAVLVINTLIGFFTELRARRAMEALARLEAARARVIRGGAECVVAASEIVPGDVILAESGDAVPADARLLESVELRVVEAALTGESMPVEKDAAARLDDDTPLPDRVNMLYRGTALSAGRARAVVVSTGMGTELGRIGGLVEAIAEERTPLERRLDELGRRLVVLTLAVAGIVAVTGVVRGAPIVEMAAMGIALAIAAVPEGLPAVVTIALAVGLRRMARRRALVRRLAAVESLGSVTVVCTDKTGTLTTGDMTVTALWIADREITVSGAGYAPEGQFFEGGRAIDARATPHLATALRTAVLASRADLGLHDGTWIAVGDPVDAALVCVARKAALDEATLESATPEVGELSFSSERQFSASFHREADGLVAHVKGAPHRLLERCDTWLATDGARALDEAARAAIHARNDAMAARGLRIIALASGRVEEFSPDALRGLTFLGLVGLSDPPAGGVKETVAALRAAGIRTLMLTGDQRRTGEAIGAELGVLAEGDESIDGREMRHLSEDELRRRIDRVAVFSRVSPEDKLTIVRALRARGAIVAMLGDGVNDAPALKQADVGVAMGKRGSDVAREAAAIVLQDDRFPTIAAAVEEGRVIFDNIRKFIFYLFSCNLAEVLLLFGAMLASLPMPLLPLHLLWLNLLTDTVPALALAFEPAERGIMRRPPRHPQAAILSRAFLRSIVVYALLIMVVSGAAFLIALHRHGDDLERARTVAFMTLALAQLFHLGNARSVDHVLTLERATANVHAVGAVILVIALQLVAVYWAPVAAVLRLSALSGGDWLLVVVMAVVPAVVGQAARTIRAPGR